MSLFGGTFGTAAPAPAPAFGTPSAQPSFGFSTGTSAPAASTAFTGFGGTSASRPFAFGGFTATTAAGTSVTTGITPSSGLGTSGFGGTAPTTIGYQFPSKPADRVPSAGGVSQNDQTAHAKAGSTGIKPKEHKISEAGFGDTLMSDIFELQKTIKKYEKIQDDASAYTLQDAAEWDAEMKRFDAASTKVQNQLSDTFATIDLLRKNTARLRSYNLLSSRLITNPQVYYSVTPAVEAYFLEILSGLRTELEIFEEELQHLENLHEQLIRPGDRYNPLDIHGTYMSLSKTVDGVAVVVNEVAKQGEIIRKEVQAAKGSVQPIPAPLQPFLPADVTQMSTRSFFNATSVGSSNAAHNMSLQTNSPLLQQVNSGVQFAVFNPAMRSGLTRMDSNTPNVAAPAGSSNTPGDYRFNQSIFGTPGS